MQPAEPQPRPIDAEARVARAWVVLDSVLDPEVPVVSVRDLGIVRDVQPHGDGIVVTLTPTYSGCPATEFIERGVREALEAAALGPVIVQTRRAPAWTSDWISAEGRRKLLAYGIVPPCTVAEASGSHASTGPVAVPMRFVPRPAARLACPRCASMNTERLAAFGSTACKALHRCLACGEPFEHFKPI
ncbi:MAG: 1,2-phenylacetyl-CoA epoxidase subunit PaaD [Caldimonas sp.]